MIRNYFGLYLALSALTLWCLLAAYAILVGPTSVLSPAGGLLWLLIVGGLLGQLVAAMWTRLIRLSKADKEQS